MSILQSLLHSILTLYKEPVQEWKRGYQTCYTDYIMNLRGHVHLERNCSWSGPDHVTGIVMGGLVYGMTLLFLVVLGLSARRSYIRYTVRRDSRPCQHCQQPTLDVSDGSHEDCQNGKYCCSFCEYDHRINEAPDMLCDDDIVEMQLVRFRNTYFYWCSECGDVVLPQEAWVEIERQLKLLDVDLGVFAAIAAANATRNAYSGN